VVEELVRLARNSPHVSQQSGVSVRTSIAALETVVANAERRALRFNEPRIVPRISDLDNISAACRGKIELVLAEDESAEDKLIAALVGEAVKNVSEQYLELDKLTPLVEKFAGGKVNVEVGDEVAAADAVANTARIAGLHDAAKALCRTCELPADDPLHLAGAVEFVLEALHVHDKLSKYVYRERTFYKK
jgi:magnesium chelatase subunit I